ncbi:MAG: hypothetical protein PF693_13670 [Spirochaetia bacterium]|jgi:hypothetical protein|nr:hypothetical protein [Spirochaetia bacterium]
MLRHSISFKARKVFSADELFPMAENWLVNRSKSSNFTKIDFKILDKKRDVEIKNKNESVSTKKYNENGFTFTSVDYKKTTSQGIYFTSVQVIKNGNGTYISGKLHTFSGDRKDIPPAGLPNIFKMLMTKAEGGLNGTLPILKNPLKIDYNSVISAFKDLDKPLLLPIVYLSEKSSKCIDSVFLAKELYAKAVVVAEGNLETATVQNKAGKISSILSFLKRKETTNNNVLTTEVFYPDGERVVIESTGNGKIEEKIISTIIGSQSRQYTPVDYRYALGKKDYCKNLNYNAPNHYCQSVFEIMVSLGSRERNRIEDSLAAGITGRTNKELLSEVNRIILFPHDQNMIKEIDYYELKKILGIISISKANV